MFDLTSARLSRLSIHLVDHEETSPQVFLSDEPVPLKDNALHELVTTFMLGSFISTNDYKRFVDKDGDFTSHTMSQLIGEYFDGSVSFHELSIRITRHLVRASQHPGIKSGDLLVGLIEDIAYGDELISAIAIIKSEQKQDFLKLLFADNKYNISSDQGININKLDKGCLIYNVRPSEGYVIASLDRTAKNTDALYWNDTFLKVQYLDDSFHLTEQYMNMAQTYVSHQLGEDFELNKGEQLGVLHEAGQFFKSNQSYDEAQFQQEVLGGKPDVIQSFQDYKKEYAQELGVEMPGQFALSNLAVKRSAKDFKSVLKLDKNFHVYIHGDRNMIEHGIDPDGRKYYKLYYDQES